MPVSSEAPSVAMWLLACLALLLVALAGFGAGRLQERARHRQALREARAQGQLLAQLLDVWQWQTDRHHRLVRLQPPAGAPAEAWSHGDWGGQPLWERFVADTDGLRAQLESMVALGDVAVRPVGAPQDGDWLLRGVPRFDAEGQFEGYVGTARAGAAASPPAAAPSLALEGESSELLSEQAAFSYTVTHDLRAPIRVVEGFARILKEDYGRVLDRIGNDHLDRVLAAAARMNSMIDALLTLANLSAQPLARQPVNLSQLAGFVVDDLRRAAARAPGGGARSRPAWWPTATRRCCAWCWRTCSATPGSTARASPQARSAVRTADRRAGGRCSTCVDNGAGFDMRYRRPAVRRVPAPAQRQRLPRHRRRPGVGEAHRAPPRRRHLGRIRARPRRALSLHVELTRLRSALATRGRCRPVSSGGGAQRGLRSGAPGAPAPRPR